MPARCRRPFAPPPLQRSRRYYGRLRPLAALRYYRPRPSGLGLSLGIAAEGSRSSTQEPETGSRRLYARRRLAHKQASSRLRPAADASDGDRSARAKAENEQARARPQDLSL